MLIVISVFLEVFGLGSKPFPLVFMQRWQRLNEKIYTYSHFYKIHTHTQIFICTDMQMKSQILFGVLKKSCKCAGTGFIRGNYPLLILIAVITSGMWHSVNTARLHIDPVWDKGHKKQEEYIHTEWHACKINKMEVLFLVTLHTWLPNFC